MKLAIRRTLVAALLVGGMTLLSTGCATGYGNDLTPELDSYSRSSEQDANLYARVIDNNTRTIWDDFARLLLIDKTSRLQPAVVP